MATGKPLIKEKMQLEDDVQRLKILKTAAEKLVFVYEDTKTAEAALVAESDFAITIDTAGGSVRSTSSHSQQGLFRGEVLSLTQENA